MVIKKQKIQPIKTLKMGNKKGILFYQSILININTIRSEIKFISRRCPTMPMYSKYNIAFSHSTKVNANWSSYNVGLIAFYYQKCFFRCLKVYDYRQSVFGRICTFIFGGA